MHADIEHLSDNAHVWIFGVSPRLDEERAGVLLSQVNAFLAGWAAHGSPIRGAAELREGSLLVVAADPDQEKSGCSIDRMFGTLRSLEKTLSVEILDSNRVFLRDNGTVRAVPRGEFRNAAHAETIVFDTTAERLGEIRSGAWEKRAADSWHRQLL